MLELTNTNFSPARKKAQIRQQKPQNLSDSNKATVSRSVSDSLIKAYYLSPVKALSFGLDKTKPAGKFYKVHTGSDNCIEIQVKKKPDLGNEPVIAIGYDDNEKSDESYSEKYGFAPGYKKKWLDDMNEMAEGENCFQAIIIQAQYIDRLHYAIYYKDTGVWDDNNGQGYLVETRSVIKKANTLDKKKHKQPLIRTLKNGSACGKVVVADTLSRLLTDLPENDGPVIAIVKNSKKPGSCNCGDISSSLKGVIFTDTTEGILTHYAASVRNETELSAMVYDEERVNALKEMEGKFVRLNLNKNRLTCTQISEPETKGPPKIKTEIQIPEITPTDKLLASSDYEPQLVGAKAFNLRRLEEMKESGKLKDVIIPGSFAIPCGVFDRALDSTPGLALIPLQFNAQYFCD